MTGFARPILGSSLLTHALLNDKPGPKVVKSGCGAIDQGALDGGLRYGEVTAIAGSSGTGKTIVSTSLIDEA